MAEYIVTEENKKCTNYTITTRCAAICLEKATKATEYDEALSWAKAGTKLVTEFCKEGDRIGYPQSITHGLYDAYVAACKDVLQRFKEE